MHTVLVGPCGTLLLSAFGDLPNHIIADYSTVKWQCAITVFQYLNILVYLDNEFDTLELSRVFNCHIIFKNNSGHCVVTNEGALVLY